MLRTQLAVQGGRPRRSVLACLKEGAHTGVCLLGSRRAPMQGACSRLASQLKEEVALTKTAKLADEEGVTPENTDSFGSSLSNRLSSIFSIYM